MVVDGSVYERLATFFHYMEFLVPFAFRVMFGLVISSICIRRFFFCSLLFGAIYLFLIPGLKSLPLSHHGRYLAQPIGT
jgi:hypothetical protein